MSSSPADVDATSNTFPLQWEVGWTKLETDTPERFVPAQVPGAVQLDWARAEGWEPYWIADNWKQYEWMEDVFWTYRCVLQTPELKPEQERKAAQKLFLRMDGVDYRFRVSLNGSLVREQEGMFAPVCVDITDLIHPAGKGENVLTVQVFPAPKSHREAQNRAQANQSCKPAVSYGWDFHPRLIPLGIWQPVWLEVREGRHFRHWDTDYTLSDDFSRAEISMDICIERDKKADRENCGGAELHWQILDETGTAVLDQKLAMEQHDLLPRLKGTVQNPRLWWPHDQGEQPLYLNRIELRSESGELLDVHEQRIGFRRVRLVMHEGAWDSPEAFPKSRSNPPITLEINGRTIFCKGANWVSPEIFPGLLARETYATQLGMTRAANMNLLRMWGGAPVQKASFYELCDELGIMVWQEFPLACNFYAGTREYLRVLQNESEAIVMKLKPHPSLVIWCGGNELFNAWSGMTDQSHALRLLNSVCFELDPERPFLMTSPVDGVGHGHYVFRDPESGQEAWEVFQKAACTAYCEFGCPGPASREVLESIIPSAELWPPKVGTAWETHHAFGVWMQSSHLYVDVLEHYFGPSDNLDVMIERGQLLQCEGYKGLYEEARRQKPKSSMALCWCLNEPWPSAANNSLISWPSKPKPALAAVGQACRPVMASARIRKFQWREGEVFDPELWLLSDSAEVRPRRQVEVWLEHAGTSTLLLTWNVPAAEANTNTQGPRVQYALPMPSARGNSAAAGSSDVAAADIKRFDLVLRAKDASGFAMHEQDSRYTLLFVPGRKQRRNPRSMN